MQHEDEIGMLKRKLVQMPAYFDFKYNGTARDALFAMLNDVLHLDANQLEVNLNDHNHYGRPCGKRFNRGESCYRCLTCGYDETCTMCSHCFQSEKHIGHEIHKSIIQKDNAGICDCGDTSAYPNTQCDHFLSLEGNTPIESMNNEQLDHLLDCFNTMLNYVIDVMHNSFACILPYTTQEEILQSVDYSSLNPDYYMEYDPPSGKYGLMMYSDQVHQYKDAVQRIKYVTRKVDDFAEMIASRCNSNGRAVVMISDNINYLLKKQEVLTSTGLTACIRSTRDIFKEEMAFDIIEWYYNFTLTNIARNNLKVRETIVKAMYMPYQRGCHLPTTSIHFKGSLVINPTTLVKKQCSLMKWEIPDDMKKSVMYPDMNEPETINPNFVGSKFQFLLFFDVRFPKEPREKLHFIYFPVMDQTFEFTGMMVAQIMDIYEDILTLFLMVDREPEFSVLPTLSPQVFTLPENAALILKHGDVLKMIKLMYNYVTTFKTSNNLLTHPRTGVVFQTLKNRKWAHVLLDLSYIITRNPDVENIFTLFFCFPEYIQFLAVFQSKPVFKREATEHVEYENQDYTVFFNAITVISLFSESISKVLNKIPKESLLSQGNPMDVLYHSYTTKVKKSFSETLYTIIVRKIIELLFMESPDQDENNKLLGLRIFNDKEDPIKFERSKYIECNVISHNILNEKVGFLHPLHSIISWMIEMDNSMDTDRSFYHLMTMIQGEYDFFLKERGGISGPGKLSSNSDCDGILAFFDIPIKKIVLISQIKVGLWVRNGNSVKTQMNLYRYSGGREFGFTRDLFLIQTFITFFPNMDHAVWNILHRWLLDDWVSGLDNDEKTYNSIQLQSMVEEFMLFLIHLTTADLHLHRLDAATVKDELIKREIIHSLSYSKLSFSEIDASIPEHISSAKRYPVIFDQTVEEVPRENTNNNTTTDSTKLYQLKEELKCKINPYYVHYTRNKTEECINYIKSKIHKETGRDKSQIVIEPIQIDWSDSIFERLNDVLSNQVVIKFVLRSLNHCIDILSNDDKLSSVKSNEEEVDAAKELEPKCCDGLLDLTLHFIHMISMHQHWTNEELSKSEIGEIFRRLVILVNLESAFNFISKSTAIIKSLRDLFERYQIDVRSIEPTFNEEIFDVPIDITPRSNNKWENDPTYKLKKKKAMKKKAKLMARLKKQQDMFAEKFIPSDNVGSDGGSDLSSSSQNLNSNEDDENINSNHSHGKPEDEAYWEFSEQTCILCHMPPANETEIFGVFGYVTESNQFRYVPYNSDYWLLNAFGGKINLDENHEFINDDITRFIEKCEKEAIMGPGFPTDGDPSNGLSYMDSNTIFTSCGHGMHYQCYSHYYESSKNKQLSQITRTSPENVERMEFFCPLCKTINNIFVPVYYTEITDNFNEEFKEDVRIDEIMKPKFDKNLINEPTILDQVTEEVTNKVKMKMNPKDWFMRREVIDGSMKFSINEKSTTPEFLMKFINHFVSLTQPPDSISSLICKMIESIEISLRGTSYNEAQLKDGKLIISQINNQTMSSLRLWLQLRSMLKCLNAVDRNDDTRKFSEKSIGVFENLINEDAYLFNGQDYFLILTMCEESLSLKLSFQKLTSIAYIKHIKQSLYGLITMILKRPDENHYQWFIDEHFDGDTDKIRKIVEAFAERPVISDNFDALYSMLLRLVTPFLRKSLILAYAKFPILSREELEIDGSLNEADRICTVLKLPTLKEVLNSLDLEEVLKISPDDKMKVTQTRIPYPSLVKLINLPYKLGDFFSQRMTWNTGASEHPVEPAICLICAKMVDLQTFNYSDKFGSCNMHIRWECIDAGRGVFFLPMSNSILLLDNGKGSFIASPYKDEYGESDENGKKGHELHLIRERFDDLQMKVWMTHNIQNVIAKKFESLSDVGGWETL